MAAKIILNAFLKALGSKSTKPKVNLIKVASDIKKASDKKKAAEAKANTPAVKKAAEAKRREHKPPVATPTPTPPSTPAKPKLQRHPEHDVAVSMLKTLGFKHAEANDAIIKSTAAVGSDVPTGDLIKHALKSSA